MSPAPRCLHHFDQVCELLVLDGELLVLILELKVAANHFIPNDNLFTVDELLVPCGLFLFA